MKIVNPSVPIPKEWLLNGLCTCKSCKAKIQLEQQDLANISVMRNAFENPVAYITCPVCHNLYAVRERDVYYPFVFHNPLRGIFRKKQ